MKKISITLSVLMITIAGLLTSCAGGELPGNTLSETSLITLETTLNETSETTVQTTPEAAVQTTKQTVQTTPMTTAATTAETRPSVTEETTSVTVKAIEEKGSYTSPEDVAEYIHTFGTLPENFITKEEAKALGWDSRAGNLWDVAPGMSIGGDYFGNYEGLLPEGKKYTECDVNYSGGFRGAERIIFSDDGAVYYTADHYESFEQLY